jgi:hypothetical protein
MVNTVGEAAQNMAWGELGKVLAPGSLRPPFSPHFRGTIGAILTTMESV